MKNIRRNIGAIVLILTIGIMGVGIAYYLGDSGADVDSEESKTIYDDASSENVVIDLESIDIESTDEAIGYKRLTSVSSVDGTNVSTIIDVQVEYLYNVITGEAIEILALYNPHIRIDGENISSNWDGSLPNIENTATTGRISFTGIVYTKTETETQYSPIITQVMNIYLSQLD